MVTFEAVYLPASSNNYDPTRGGFPSERAAWDYVSTRLCPDCRHELIHQHVEAGIEYPELTACGAEWLVAKEVE